MELKGSQTEKNILTAFAGESQARNKYTYFATQAKKEGYEQVAAISQKPPIRKRPMPRAFSNSWSVATQW